MADAIEVQLTALAEVDNAELRRRWTDLYEALCQLQVKSNETRLAQIPVELSPIESGNVAGPLRRRYAQFVG